jgi:hypothetical protein
LVTRFCRQTAGLRSSGWPLVDSSLAVLERFGGPPGGGQPRHPLPAAGWTEAILRAAYLQETARVLGIIESAIGEVPEPGAPGFDPVPPDDDIVAMSVTLARLAQSLLLTQDAPPTLHTRARMREHAELVIVPRCCPAGVADSSVQRVLVGPDR